MAIAETRPRAAWARLTPQVWRILAHSLIFGLALSVADLLFNFYLVSLGYDAAVAGLLSTVGRGAGMVLGLPIGVLIDRVGSQRALVVGVLLYCVGWALLLASRDLWAIVLTQFFIGGAFLMATTSVTPLLAQVARPEDRAMVFGLNASASLIIGLLGSVVGGLLPSLVAGLLDVGPQDAAAYRIALISVIVLSVVAILPVVRHLPAAPTAASVIAADTAAARLPIRKMARYGLAGLLLGVSGGLILPFQNLFFRQQFGLSDAAVGVVLAWIALGMGFGALLGAPLAARIGLRRGAALLRLGAVPSMLLMLTPMMIPAAIGLLLRGLFVAASFPLNDALVMHATPTRQRGMATSLTSLMWSGGWAASAALSGWIQLRWGFTPVILITTLFYVFSTLAIITLPDDKQG